MTTYSEKLRDPRWQKKRLEVMQRDGFKCSECCDKESTLHVHHTRYIKNANPWDYPNCLLTTLCESCHEALHSGVLSGFEYLQHVFDERCAPAVLLPCLGFAVEQVMAPDLRMRAEDWVACGRAFTAKMEEILAHSPNGGVSES